jgi:glycosyltransferase involved in cell wall biosynthesis
MKFLLVNWTQIDELKGGCETIFSELSKIITEMGHETKMVSFNSAKRVLGIGLEKSSMGFFEAEASHIIDRYCSHYVKLFPETIIISNAGITNFWYKNPNTINMQEKSAEGAKNIAISEFMANEMRKIGIEPYRIIPHGIDLELFKPMDKEELREKYNVPKDMTVAVWSKSFEPTSGFHIISNLVKKFKDIFWVLNFKNQQNYKPKAKNVLIVQPIEREKMPELYNLADLCINPSVAESFGLVPLEAMACGVPCILSNTGFVWEKDMEKDIEERTYGLLVNRWDTKAFSEAIEMMLEGKSKFRPREFAEKYNMEKWKSDWKEIINEPRIL